VGVVPRYPQNSTLKPTSMKNISILLCLTLVLGPSCLHKKSITEESTPSAPKISLSKIEEGIKGWIDREVTRSDGYFHLHDGEKELKLKLVRVHTEYLSQLGPEKFFACVDLADVSGDVYDVDFFMEGHPDAMEVTETSVHKLNGKPYYSWRQRKDKTWRKVPMQEATRELLGVIEGEDTFEFFYRATLPDLTGPAQLWLPLAQADPWQQVEVLKMEVPMPHQVLTDDAYGNKILYLEPLQEHSGAELMIHYRVIRQEKPPYEAPEPKGLEYLEETPLMPVGGRFGHLAHEAIGTKAEESTLMQARAIYDYIIDNMRYMKFGNFGRGDANYACDSKTGNCTEFHSLFISMARSVDIPARFAIGASIPSDRNEGGIDGYHCWAEFYAEGKWWPVDISEANKYTALATYYFGRHPANRVELSRGRELVVQPGPLAGPINFLAYPVLEVGGESLHVPVTFSFHRPQPSL
jgi:transglutaminase-like putative cysteine protease